MPKLDVREIAVQNTAWNAAAKAVSAVAGVATSIILARALGREQMGAFTYTLWIAGVAATLSGLGIPQTVGRYVGEYAGREDIGKAGLLVRKLSFAQLLLGAVAATAIVPIAIGVARITDYRAVAVTALLIVPLGLQPVLLSALAGTQRYVYVGIVTAGGSLVQLAGVAIASLFHAGVVSMLGCVLAGLIASIGVALLFCRRMMPSTAAILPAAEHQFFTPVRKFAWTISYLVLLDLIIWDQVEVLFLKHYSGLAHVAFFGLACSIAGRLHSLGAIFTDLTMPLSAYAYGRGGKSGLAEMYVWSLKHLQIAMVPLCIFAILLCRPAVTLLYGQQYAPLVPPLQVLLGSLAFNTLGNVACGAVYALEKQKFFLYITTAIASLNLLLDWLLIPRFGAFGAALGSGMTQVLWVAGSIAYAGVLLRSGFPWRSAVRTYGAALTAALPLIIVAIRGGSLYTLLAAAGVGMVLYLPVLSLCGERTVWRRLLSVSKHPVAVQEPGY